MPREFFNSKYLFNVRRAIIAKVEHTTIQHVNCAVLIQEGDRCAACSRRRKPLLVKVSHQRKRIEGQPHMNALNKCYPTNTYMNYLLHKIQSIVLVIKYALQICMHAQGSLPRLMA